MKKLLLISLPLLFSANAFADDVIFSCFTKSGKHISVIQKGNQYEYSFGKPGKPELVFQNSIKDVIKRSQTWDGVGRYMWANLALKNGTTFYTARVSIDRMEQEIEHSLEVERGEKHLATIICSPKREIIVNFPDELGVW